MNYEQLQALLARVRDAVDMNSPGLVDRLVADPVDGALKLHVTRCALRLRREHRALFAKGSYVPLRAMGTRHKNVIAFARSFRGAQSS